MRYAIDCMAIIGGILIAAGVFIEFGAGFSAIAGGVFLFVFALLSAKAYESNINVSNSE